MRESDIVQFLQDRPLRGQLVSHPFLAKMERGELTKAQTETVLGQWWHPLHYFPSFIGRAIAVLPALESRTALARILFQELGESDPERAHEAIYATTMTDAGFGLQAVTGAAPFEATRLLVKGYEDATMEAFSALGFIYATEVADLVMVSRIGEAVRRATGRKKLEWVDIHVEQEPEHVAKVKKAVGPSFTHEEVERIISHADRMWQLWIDFFSRIGAEVS